MSFWVQNLTKIQKIKIKGNISLFEKYVFINKIGKISPHLDEGFFFKFLK
jgi:hypothetical protein